QSSVTSTLPDGVTVIEDTLSDDPEDATTETEDPTVTTLNQNGSIEITTNDVLDLGADGVLNAGDIITYTVVISNNGNVTLSDISVTDTGIDFGMNPTTISDLAVGTSETFTGTYVLTQADIDTGNYTVQSSVTSTLPDGVTVIEDTLSDDPEDATTETEDPTVTTLNQNGSIEITTNDVLDLGADGVLNAGDIITYTLVVSNNGNVTLSDISVTDTGIDFGTNPTTVGTLAVGTSETFTGTYVLTQADIDTGNYTVQSSVTSTLPDGVTVIEDTLSDDPEDATTETEDPTVTTLNQNGSIEITTNDVLDLGADGVLNAGDIITYTVVISNNGNVTLSDISVTDTGIDFGMNPTTVASLAVGTSETFTGIYVLTQADIDAGNYTVQSSVTSTLPDGVTVIEDTLSDDPEDVTTETEDPTVTTLNQSGNIEITTNDVLDLGTDGVLNAGDIITYTVVVSNNGNVTLSDISVTDTGIDFGMNPTTVGTLAVGTLETFTGTYVLTQADIDAGNYTVQSSVTSTLPDGVTVIEDTLSDDPEDGTTETEDPTVTTLNQSGNIEITTNDVLDLGADGVLNAGDIITYTVVVSNNGNVTLSDISVTDTGIDFGTNPTTVGTLAVGTSETFTGTYIITQADIDAGNYTVQSSVTSTLPDGVTVIEDTLSDDPEDATTETEDPTVTTLNQNGSIEITTNDVLDLGTDGVLNAGDIITYTVVVSNNGNVTLSDISVTDTGIDFGMNPTTVASLAVGTSETFTGIYVLTQADIDAGNYTVQSSVTSTLPDGVTVIEDTLSDDPEDATTETEDPTVTTLNQNGSIEITTNDALDLGADGVLNAGDVITYTVVVSNNGNVTLSNISVTDTGIDFGMNPTTVANLAVGTSETFTGTYIITQADIDAGNYTVQSSVTSTLPDGVTIIEDTLSDDPEDGTTETEDPTVTTLNQNGSIEITTNDVLDLGADGVLNAGDIITYTVVVSNNGNVTLSNISVTDTGIDFG
ncbi:beta strand repeat-containing protein, partial [Aureivirga sp. CE67]|uniref:beta strand repeat-containing protein n=1 Tax=Aureivirga sp. CE67 TaxID=1788983 RepID=UPI0018C9C0C3